MQRISIRDQAKFWTEKRLAKRMLVSILLFSSLVTLAGVGFQLYLDYRRDMLEVDNQVENIRIGHLESLTTSLWKIDLLQLETELRNIVKMRDVIGARIKEFDIVTSSEGSFPESEEDLRLHRFDMVFDDEGTIHDIGRLEILVSLTGVYDRLFDRLSVIVVTQGLKTFLVSVFILLVFHFLVFRHLNAIAAYVSELNLNGLGRKLVLDRPCQQAGNADELQILVDSFNQTNERLAQNLAEMERIAALQRESDRRSRAILDQTFQFIGLLSPDGTVGEINRTALDFCAIGLRDVLGKPFWTTPWWSHSAEEREKLEDAIGEAAKGGFVRFETTHPRLDGTLAHIDFSMKPVFDEKGHAELLIAEGRDISSRKAVEEQLRQAQRLEAVGQLTGGVAHDFNNMLMVMSANLELLETLVDNEERAKKYIGAARRAITRGTELTQRLLAFSRRQSLEPTTVRLAELVPNTEDMLRRSLGETIDLTVELPQGLWDVAIDPGQLEVALINLALNSRDAMSGAGKLSVYAANAKLDEEIRDSGETVRAGDYVSLSVTDSGEGMPPEIQERVFEPFFTTKELGKGSGLGLSMVYGFIRQSEGHIEVESEPGHGTTVRLYLPRAA